MPEDFTPEPSQATGGTLYLGAQILLPGRGFKLNCHWDSVPLCPQGHHTEGTTLGAGIQ